MTDLVNASTQTTDDMTSGSTPSTSYWDLANKATRASGMASIAMGTGLGNAIVRASGFGLLALVKAEKTTEWFICDRESSNKASAELVSNLTGAVGTAIWAAGLGAGSKEMVVLGPALNFLGNIGSIGVAYATNDSGKFREAIDAAEHLTFAIAGYTGSPAARAAAFGCAAAGFAFDTIKSNQPLLGHAVGAAVWATGAGTQQITPQVIGPALVAASEFASIGVISRALGRLFGSGTSKSHGKPILPLTQRDAQTQSVDNSTIGAQESDIASMVRGLGYNPQALAAVIHASSTEPRKESNPTAFSFGDESSMSSVTNIASAAASRSVAKSNSFTVGGGTASTSPQTIQRPAGVRTRLR